MNEKNSRQIFSSQAGNYPTCCVCNNTSPNPSEQYYTSPIPKKYLLGGGRNEGNITFSSCCGTICTDKCVKDGDSWRCVLGIDTNPNWIRQVTQSEGINSPCPIGRVGVPCYFASDRRCVPQDDL